MMDASVSRYGAKGTRPDATTPTSQSPRRSAQRYPRQGTIPTSTSRREISGIGATSDMNSVDGATGVDDPEITVVAEYAELAESTAKKLQRVPERYQDFLLRLYETLRCSSADLAARLFPSLSEAHQQRALLALLATECAGDAFVHDRIGAVPRKLTWVVPFDGRVFAPTDLQVYVFESENPAELQGRDYSIEAWGRRWLDQSKGSDNSDSESSK